MPTDKAREILHRAYMQGYRDGRNAALAERPRALRRTEAIRMLLDELDKGPRPAVQIRTYMLNQGVSKNTLERAKSEAGIVSVQVKEQTGKTWYWSRPQDAANISHTQNPNHVPLWDSGGTIPHTA